MENSVLFFIYFLLIYLFFNFSSPFLFWIMLEINLVLFILLSNFYDSWNFKTDMFNQGLLYFVIQSLGSSIFLFSNMKIFNLDYGMEFLMLLISISLKMGIFPFHYWIYNFSKYANYLSLFFILTLQKIPLMLFFSNFFSFSMFSLILLNLIMGSIFLLYSYDLSEILVSSSMYNLIWLMIFIFMVPSMFFIMFLNYFIFLFILCFNLKGMIFSFQSLDKLMLIFSSIFLMGLPPFSMFFFKFYSMDLMIMFMPSFILMILWILTFLSLFSYFKFFYKFLFQNFSLYKRMTKASFFFFLYSYFPLLSFFLFFF